METAKRQLLDSTHLAVLEMGIESKITIPLGDIVSPEIVGFGTAIDEKIFGIQEVQKLLKRQKEQTEGIQVDWNFKTLNIHISPDENTAVIIDDVFLKIVSDQELEMYLRFSMVLEFDGKKWVLIHWHGSKPEEVASEEDTWGIESWKEKAEVLEKEVAARTADLVLKNKDLAVEAALERVRAKTMAMHATTELQQVIHAVHEELLKLEIRILGGSFIVINSEIGDEISCWGSGGTAEYSNEVHIPFYDKPFYTNLVRGLKAGPGFFTEEFNQEEKQAFFTFLFQHEPWSKLDSKEQQEALLSPGAYTRSCAVFENTSIFIINQSGVPFSSEENEILKRFGKVFEQAYTRFLDLQKAEEQAKEAKIEAALEKIRSRSMGMQSSDELPEVANLLFTEVRALGIHAWSCGYNILAKDNKTATCSMSSEGTMQTPFELRLWGEASFDEMGDFIRSDKTLLVQELGDKALEEHYAYMKSFPDLKPTFDEIDRLGLSLPTYQINHLCKFNQGFILFITYEKVPDAHDIFKRFTKVFDQTYTRFLDLQRAEAQAREAQIEAALERVRSRTMTMQKAEELGDVAMVLFSELNSLVDNLWTCGFVLCEKTREESQWWLSLNNELIEPFSLPNKGDFAHESLYQGWLKQDSYQAVSLEGQQLQGHYDRLMKIAIIKKVFKEMEGSGRSLPTWQQLHAAYFKTGYLIIITEVPSEEKEIFKRFAQVFDLAYRRFEDLKKAEARIREEKVKSALERVRSRSLAMHESSELKEVIKTVSDQFKELEIDISGGAFIVINKDVQNEFYCWGAGGVGNYVRKVKIPFIDLSIYHTLSQGIKNGVPFFTEFYGVDEKRAFFKHLFNNEPFKNTPMQRQEYLLSQNSSYSRSCVVSDKTSIFIINHEGKPFSEEENEFLRQMGKVFEQAYTRFIDLEKAEHQARLIIEERDRLEIALEELKATQSQLIQSEKMASLGELTAGIAHEIQNPLNFVNNFSEVSGELIEEIEEERARSQESRDETLVNEILGDIKENLSKINHHGKRADAIVKGMLEHSRANKGEKAPTDMNALADEFVRLSYHGLRAKDKNFNAAFKLELDPDLPKANVVASDIGRVILNLVNNAFYAVDEKAKSTPQPSRNIGTGSEGGEKYTPEVSVSTSVVKSPSGDLGVELSVQDNGGGIPEQVRDKIFQPFFTTKPTGSGTGLGLSLSYDIIKAHGGIIKIESRSTEGVVFIISIPVNKTK